MPDVNCKMCQGTGFKPTQSAPGEIIVEACPACCISHENIKEEPGWHLKLTFHKGNGQYVERPLLSVSGGGEVRIQEPLNLQELMVLVDKKFTHGVIWQALVLALSELRRVQDRVAALESKLGG